MANKWQHLNGSLTAYSHNLSCDVPLWPTTNVPRVVSMPWYTYFTYPGNCTTRSSRLSVVLYWRRRGGYCDLTSRRRDVSDSASTSNVDSVSTSDDDVSVRVSDVSTGDSVDSHFCWSEWSSTDTRQIQRKKPAMYSWRSLWQTTMSHG